MIPRDETPAPRFGATPAFGSPAPELGDKPTGWPDLAKGSVAPVGTPRFQPPDPPATAPVGTPRFTTQPWTPPAPTMLPKGSYRTKGTTQLTPYSYEVSEIERDRLIEEDDDVPREQTATVSAVPLTWKAYRKLSDEQRAAVEFNTLLVEAREKDLRYPKSYTNEEMEQYNKDVERIFGEAGGSDTVGYNTIELLKRIDFTAVGQDLDEFLSLERGISVEEIGDFTFTSREINALEEFNLSDKGVVQSDVTLKGPVRGTPEGMARNIEDGYQSAADSLKALEDRGFSPLARDKYRNVRSALNMKAIDTALAKNVIAAFRRRISAQEGAPWSIQASLGVQQDFLPSEIPAGYNRGPEGTTVGDEDKTLQDVYTHLRTHPDEEGLRLLFQDFEDRDWSEKSKQMLWNFLDERTRLDIDILGDRSAQQVRDILGWK